MILISTLYGECRGGGLQEDTRLHYGQIRDHHHHIQLALE